MVALHLRNLSVVNVLVLETCRNSILEDTIDKLTVTILQDNNEAGSVRETFFPVTFMHDPILRNSKIVTDVYTIAIRPVALPITLVFALEIPSARIETLKAKGC